MKGRKEHRPDPVRSPLTVWVHRGVDAPAYRATIFDPPLPGPAPSRGWPIWIVEHRGRELVFASPEEIRHAIDVLGRRVMPRARDLAGPHLPRNRHWLSRLHSSWKSWKVRQRLTKTLARLLTEG
ncbi:hypothetical protein GC169_12130 [bacterium]|nr:hypothetical protein [bacterium]